MLVLARTLRRAILARDLAVTQRNAARAEADRERRLRQRTERHALDLAARLDELTIANQSYDKEATS
ncbi:hypothetical protein ACFVQ4_25140 [Streptomyces laurentii]|uniref:hypothetical protein n=1 Tax=Streptomyces laurentii TaxID=39478 RepID=UPI0036BBFF7A